MSKLTVQIPEDLHHDLKIIAVKNNRTMKSMVSQVVNALIQNNGRIPTKQDAIREYWRINSRSYYNRHKDKINTRRKLKRMQKRNLGIDNIFETILGQAA